MPASTILYFTNLDEKSAGVLLLFLKKPQTYRLHDLRKLSNSGELGYISWSKMSNILAFLESRKYIKKEEVKIGKRKKQVLYSIDLNFFDDWREERMRLSLKHMRAEYDMGKEIPMEKLYDAKTLKYFLLPMNK